MHCRGRFVGEVAAVVVVVCRSARLAGYAVVVAAGVTMVPSRNARLKAPWSASRPRMWLATRRPHCNSAAAYRSKSGATEPEEEAGKEIEEEEKAVAVVVVPGRERRSPQLARWWRRWMWV